MSEVINEANETNQESKVNGKVESTNEQSKESLNGGGLSVTMCSNPVLKKNS